MSIETLPQRVRCQTLILENSWSQDFHPATSHEMIHVLSGKATLLFENGLKFFATRGQTLFISKGTVHRDFFSSHIDYKTLMTFFHWDGAEQFFDVVNNVKMERLESPFTDKLEWYFARLRDNESANVGDALSRSLLHVILLSIYHELSSIKTIELKPVTQASSERIINAAQAYTRRNYATVTLSEVARHLKLSNSYFSRLFHATTGQSWLTYLSRIRMDVAGELLLDSKLQIAEIATRIGYSNANYFARIFRCYHHTTPGDFRRQYVHEDYR